MPEDDSKLKNKIQGNNNMAQVGFEPTTFRLQIYCSAVSAIEPRWSQKLIEIYVLVISHSDLLAQTRARMTANASVDASMPVLVQEPERVSVSIWSENRLTFMSV